MPPRKFAEEFDPTRGDLVYGRSDVRDEYDKTLTKEQAEAIAAGAWVRIDVYNNASVVAGVQHAAMSNARDQTLEFAQEADKGTGPGDVVNYANAILGSRYSPEHVMTAPQNKLDREMSSRRDAQHEWLAIRRACKFGIEYVVRVKGNARIHFLLDEIDMADVVSKAKFQGSGRRGPVVPITTSELRAIYRNWHRAEYRLGVIFYVKGVEVAPPWESERQLWNGYGQYRVDKYRAVLEKELDRYRTLFAKNGPKLNDLTRKIKKVDKDAKDLVVARRFAEAVEMLQGVIREFAPQAVEQD